MPPANLILAALHAIRVAAEKTNQRLDETNQRLDALVAEVKATNGRIDETNERLDSLRDFTVKHLTSLNTKIDTLNERLNGLNDRIDGLTEKVDRMGGELRQLNARFDHFLTGEGSKLVKRMETVELELKRIATKVDH